MSDYEFNDCDVCVNPEVKILASYPPRWKAELLLAKAPKGWVYGRSYEYNIGGCSCGAMDHPPYFKTKDEAYFHGLDDAIKYFQKKEHPYDPADTVPPKFLKELKLNQTPDLFGI